MSTLLSASALALVALVWCWTERMRTLQAFRTFVSRRNCHGWLCIELRRRVALARMAGEPFPRPREERLRVVWVAGVPIFMSRASVGLPPWYDARIDQVEPGEADESFLSPWRLSTLRHGPG
jgi:hypothetical protein